MGKSFFPHVDTSMLRGRKEQPTLLRLLLLLPRCLLACVRACVRACERESVCEPITADLLHCTERISLRPVPTREEEEEE